MNRFFFIACIYFVGKTTLSQNTNSWPFYTKDIDVLKKS